MRTINLQQSIFSVILCIILTSCADEEQEKKYQTLRIETTKLISQVELVIKDQKAKFDSLNKIGEDYVSHRISTIDIDGVHKATMNTIDIQESMNILKIHLESIKFYCTIIEKACTRFGYFFKRKSKIKWTYSKLIYDTNIEINDITGGLTSKDFIYKYLPDKYK